MVARNTVHNVGRAGIVRDTNPHLLPSEFWTGGLNVRFDANKIASMQGVQSILTKSGLLNGGIISSVTQSYFIYTTGTKVYAWDGATEGDITRATGGDYSEDIDHLFQILPYNGLGILNNGINVPQLWVPTDVGTKLVALPNWDPLWQAKKIRSFKNFLFAINMTEGADAYPHKIRWSHPAEPGAVPVSWDETDATKETGEFSFADTDKGKLVDGRTLGEQFFIYKEGSIWAFSYVGGLSIFQRVLVVENIGLAAERSLVTLPFFRDGRSSVHFFADNENFYIMDGLRPLPVWEDIFKYEFQKIANLDNWRNRSFGVVNPTKNELWFCFPEQGEEYCTLAFVLNYQNGSSTIKELSGASQIVEGYGQYATVGSSIGDIPFSDETLFSDDTGFYSTETNAAQQILIEASPTKEKLFYLETGTTDYDGNNYYSYVMREAIATIKNDSRNEKADIVDYNRRKMVHSITPKLYDGSIGLKVGVQESENTLIDWVDFGLVMPEEYKLFLTEPLSGRFISFMFYSIPGEKFEIAGFDYEISVLGEF